ncbi:hypothetical protein NPIL_442421, partial [Nephila pilipes]
VPLGSHSIVILHGGDVIREAFSKPEVLGRPPDGTMKLMTPN